MDQLPQQFFTAESLATLAGVSGATFAVKPPETLVAAG